MPTFWGNTFSSYFNRILQFGHSGNSGTPTATTNIQAGNGVATSISLSDDVLSVQPVNDDTTGTMLVKTQSGSNILAVDTDNERVLVGSSQSNALTMYKTFFAASLVPTGAGSHMVLATSGTTFGSSGHAEINLGNDANPAEVLDVSENAGHTNAILPTFWYLPDAITIMSATVLMGGYHATDSVLNFHLMSYTMDTSTNFGDLSGGVVIADSGTTTAVDQDVIKVDTMNNLPTDVASGKVILATVESDGTSQLSIQMIVKYHIQ